MDGRMHGFVISALGRTTPALALARIVGAVGLHGLTVGRIETLSEEGGSYAARAIFAEGELQDEPGLRGELLAISQELQVDAVLHRAAEYGAERKLFCFDMDSTLIQGETIDELAKMAGVGEQVVAITAAAMRGELVFQESFRKRVGLLKGLPEARVLEALDRLPLMEGAERLFRTLKARGAKTAIFSGGFTFFGNYLKEKLGVDYVFANHLDVRDGVVTGEVIGGIVDGARKAELLIEVAEREGIPLEQVCAVGDGANDLPMLGLAGMGVAFHAKPVVRAAARYAVTHVGLDGLLYLLGVPDGEWA
jgi:phosphoserine phosphatase